MSYVYKKNVKYRQNQNQRFFFRKTSFEAIIAILNSLKSLDMLNFAFLLCQQRDMALVIN